MMEKRKSRRGDLFLFGFDLNNEATRQEYGKYYTYMNHIHSILNEFGIHIGNSGYTYIIDAVKIMIDRNDHSLRLKTDVYPLISEKYHTKNQSVVEHSIRNAINTAYRDHLIEPESNSMGFFTRRPTIKQFLKYLADATEQRMCESLMRTAG